MTKECIMCGNEFEVSTVAVCCSPKCTKNRARERARINQQKHRDIHPATREKKDERNKKAREYRVNNLDVVKTKELASYRKHAEKRKAYKRLHYKNTTKEDKLKLYEQQKIYKKANPHIAIKGFKKFKENNPDYIAPSRDTKEKRSVLDKKYRDSPSGQKKIRKQNKKVISDNNKSRVIAENHYSAWDNPQEDMELLNLKELGLTPNVIAEKMGRTIHSIQSRYKYLKKG